MNSWRRARSIALVLGVATAGAVALFQYSGPAQAQDEDLDAFDAMSENAPVEEPDELGGLDDLEDLGGLDDFDSLGGAADAPAAVRIDRSEEPALTYSFNGYVKPLAVWETREYPASFGISNKNRYTTVGVRTQLLIQGALRDKAQFFTAANLDFNEVNQTTDTVSETSQNADVRMVESYLDLFGETTRWRLGSQLVTWGFMDGFEVPTDRLNARDFAYKSSELEDFKLASTGAQFTWNASDKQKISLFYIPVGKVNRLSPDFENIFTADAENPSVQSGNAKSAFIYSGSVGLVDYAVSYVDGTNPAPDLGCELSKPDPTCELSTSSRFRKYHRYHSPGLDLQFDFGSLLGRLSAVWYDTGDVGNNDPLRQNDWQQVMVGAEFWLGSALVSLNVGQKTVSDYDDDPSLDFNNILLGQVAETTNIVAGLFTDSYLTGAALELNFLFSYSADAKSGEVLGLNLRPSIAYNLGDGLAVMIIPAYSEFIGIVSYSIYTEAKLSF